MKVTEVQILPVKPKEGLVGFASAVLDDKLYISGMGVHKIKDGSGYRITYPEKLVGKAKLGVYHPITKELGKALEQEVNKKCLEMFEYEVGRDG